MDRSVAGGNVDIRIGIVQSMKEIEVELADEADRAAVQAEIETALEKDAVLWLTDKRGRRIGVPAARIAYVEIGMPNRERRVGFGAA
jgi:hypothetical protein